MFETVISSRKAGDNFKTTFYINVAIYEDEDHYDIVQIVLAYNVDKKYIFSMVILDYPKLTHWKIWPHQ